MIEKIVNGGEVLKKVLVIATVILSSVTLSACKSNSSTDVPVPTKQERVKVKEVALSDFLNRNIEDSKPTIFYMTFDARDSELPPEYAIVFENGKATYYDMSSPSSLTMAELSAMTNNEQLATILDTHHISYLNQLNEAKKKLVEVLDQYDLAIAEARGNRELEKGPTVRHLVDYEKPTENRYSSSTSSSSDTSTTSKPKMNIAIDTEGTDLHYLEIPYDLTVAKDAEEWYKRTNGVTKNNSFQSLYSYQQIQEAREKIKLIDSIIESKNYEQIKGYTPVSGLYTLKLLVSSFDRKVKTEQVSMEFDVASIDNWLDNPSTNSNGVVETKQLVETFEGSKKFIINGGSYSGLLIDKNDNEALITSVSKDKKVTLDKATTRAPFLTTEKE